MPISPPAGFATRPEASKLFNRSQRQLERDLDVAYLAEDDQVLCRYKLMTKDGAVRDAKDVSTQQVKKLQSEGMIPVWYVAMSYLEQEYGKKGEPKPAKSSENVDSKNTLQKAPNKSEADSTGRQAESGKSVKNPLLLGDAEFWREQVRTLEQQNKDERVRHDRIVGKLFEQLDVKDKQISAWDEVTQGLTKGLATGQLAPRLPLPADDRSNEFRVDADESKNDHMQEAKLVETSDDKSPQSDPVVSKIHRNGLDSERDSTTAAAVIKNSSEDAKSSPVPIADKTDTSVTEKTTVGEGSAPSGKTNPSNQKKRKSSQKKNSRKKNVSKKKSRASIKNSRTKVASGKSPTKSDRKSGGLLSRFFRR